MLSRGCSQMRVPLRANFQIQVLSSLFFRNKGAYVVGKIINGFTEMPFALPILHDADGRLIHRRGALFGEDDLLMLFSFARAYFMVDMEVPSPTCSSCAPDAAQAARRALQRDRPAEAGQEHLLPRLPLPPAPQQRPLPHRARHQGMVMLVFDLPSFPFVFKVIKDFYPPQKETTRELIQSKYLLVKQHDRVGAWPTRWSTATSPSRARASSRAGRGAEALLPQSLEIEDGTATRW